ncbi:MAG: hypothetical protein MSA01_05265 [Anaeromassilibacillus sp.]|nr:hypothetical protein [Anaeromassilibacillus sp.]MDY3779130.1 flavodoxin [Candidatus Limousia pullorum]
MKKIILSLMMIVSMIFCLCACGQTSGKALPQGEKDTLVVYFSRTGNTADAAQIIADYTGADIIRITRAEPYPDNLEACVKEVSEEMQSSELPAINEKVNNMNSYDVVFLCYPIWLNSIPMPMVTFMEENNLSGKYIIPVATHSGSEFGNSISVIQSHSGNAKILDGIALLNGNTQGLTEKLSEYGYN